MSYQADSLEPFDLLKELGKDCVGAIQLLSDEEEPTDLYSVKYRSLSESDIASTLRNMTEALLLGWHDDTDDLRLSIAGAQVKQLYCGMTTVDVCLWVIHRRLIFSRYRSGSEESPAIGG